MVRLSDREVAILLGATLMHWGVPFRRVTYRRLDAHQEGVVRQANDKLLAGRPAGQASFDLTPGEMALLADIVEYCLEECGTDHVDLRLHLQANDHAEVVTLLDRLRSALNPVESTHP